MSRSMMNGAKLIILIILAVLAGCDWFDEAVEANLPPETELLECGAPQGVTEGDNVRFVWGGSDIDGHVSGFEVSFDTAPWEPTPLESLTVSEITLGDHVFKVRAVDDDGDVDPNPAQCSFTASAAGHLVDRIVVLELFTTNECPNCPKAEIALNVLVDEMGTGTVSVVAYHDRPSYSPDSDALATGQTDQRIAWYTGNPGFPGESDTWPTVVFDGLRIVEGAKTAEEAEAFYRSEISLREDVGTPVSLRVEGDIGGDQGSVTVVARAEDVPPGGALVLRFAVVEDSVKYRGFWANRFDFVARLLLEEEALDLVAVGDSARIEREFMVDPSWVVEKLDVIAFIQDTGTREVFQSGRLKSN